METIVLNFIRRNEVLRRTGLTRSTLSRLIEAGDFPPGVRLSERIRAWQEADIDAWARKRVALSHGSPR